MENFCKGLVFGMVTGILIGAVSVAKNKKLSGMVKEKAEIVEKKISDMTEKMKDKEDKSQENYEISCSEQCNSCCENS